MNTALWIAQVLLARIFALVSLVMLTTPKGKIVQRVPWAESSARLPQSS